LPLVVFAPGYYRTTANWARMDAYVEPPSGAGGSVIELLDMP